MPPVARPQPGEATSNYFKYFDLVPGTDPLGAMLAQVNEMAVLGAGVSEEQSLFRYAPGKWSMRQVLNHVSDIERAFAFRALWFARGFEPPLPGYDHDIATPAAEADALPWSAHLEEFRHVRLATLALFANLPAAAWDRTGTANDRRFSVRALAYFIPGHAAHHFALLRERYLAR